MHRHAGTGEGITKGKSGATGQMPTSVAKHRFVGGDGCQGGTPHFAAFPFRRQADADRLRTLIGDIKQLRPSINGSRQCESGIARVLDADEHGLVPGILRLLFLREADRCPQEDGQQREERDAGVERKHERRSVRQCTAIFFSFHVSSIGCMCVSVLQCAHGT